MVKEIQLTDLQFLLTNVESDVIERLLFTVTNILSASLYFFKLQKSVKHNFWCNKFADIFSLMVLALQQRWLFLSIRYLSFLKLSVILFNLFQFQIISVLLPENALKFLNNKIKRQLYFSNCTNKLIEVLNK